MKTLISLKKTLLLAACLAFVIGAQAQSLESKIDQLLAAKYKTGEPGATALVTKKGKVIYRKAFGNANLELDVPMKPENIFEIGSITKQFTAVSILMLLEEGKLSLGDEITKFIPDYPTHGKKITVHHLLTHTSGIKSYTSMDVNKIARTDMKPLELIDYFKNEPMDFDPGEKYRYNNSGYVILGYIIEKLAGETYEDFVENKLFKKAGMSSSYYGSHTQIIKDRAFGYQKRGDYTNANYLSMTLPYAAGSLMSNIDDLFKWQQAINNNVFVKKETINKAFTNHALNNGKKINYGYGWGINEINGFPTIEHGGGIFGYTTQGIYIPKKDVYVAVLTNCDCNSPSNVATRIAALAIGKPYPTANDKVTIAATTLQKYVGVYDFEGGASRVITIDGNQLYSARDGSNKFKIHPLNQNDFYFEDSFATIHFDSKTNPISAKFTSRINKEKGAKTNKPIPAERKEITLSEDVLKPYVGVYELKPGFDLTITIEDGHLYGQPTGQNKFELFAESETKFFLKAIAAQLEFIKDEDGNATGCILYQGGQKIPAKKKS